MNVKIINCTFNGIENGNVIENVDGFIIENVNINGRRIDAGLK